MMSISLVILIETKPNCNTLQIEAFKKLSPLVLAEKGCISYDLFQVEGDENQFILTEEWDSVEALEAHDATPHMIEADANSPSFRAKPATVYKVNKI